MKAGAAGRRRVAAPDAQSPLKVRRRAPAAPVEAAAMNFSGYIRLGKLLYAGNPAVPCERTCAGCGDHAFTARAYDGRRARLRRCCALFGAQHRQAPPLAPRPGARQTGRFATLCIL